MDEARGDEVAGWRVEAWARWFWLYDRLPRLVRQFVPRRFV